MSNNEAGAYATANVKLVKQMPAARSEEGNETVLDTIALLETLQAKCQVVGIRRVLGFPIVFSSRRKGQMF